MRDAAITLRRATLRRARTAPARAAASTVGFFEFWPGWLFYAPVIAQWTVLTLRHRSIGLPTAANPRIELGGLCGESKSAILDLVEPAERGVLAPYVCITAGWGRPGADAAEAAMAKTGLAYPVIAKPDIGCNGTGVRLLRDRSDLYRYLADFPTGKRLVLQRFIAEDGEAGIFYVRHPDEPSGRISSLTLKSAPTVTGDGRSSIEQLIHAEPRLGRLAHMFLPRLGERARSVPLAGERVPLLLVGNHCKGSLFRDGRDDITPALTARIDAIARAVPDFHFGRLDVRFGSLAALRRGEGFTIIEINGVGSEATHVWDPNTRLLDAWAAELEHFSEAFAIGAAMRARGHRPAGMKAMWRQWQLQRRLMASYPTHD